MPDKEEFGVKMQQQLDQWQQKVQEAEKRASEKEPEVQQQLRPELDAVAARYEEARYKLKLLRMSSADAWDEMRHGFEKAFDELKNSLDKALSRF